VRAELSTIDVGALTSPRAAGGRVYTVVDFVADQLRAMHPGGAWKIENIDRAVELASMFVRRGITDMAKLSIVPSTFVSYELDPTYQGPAEDQVQRAVENPSYAFSFENRKIGFLGEQDRASNLDTFKFTGRGWLVAWSAAGHGNVAYYLAQNANGFFIDPEWNSSSDAAKIRTGVIFIGSVVVFAALPAAGISVAGSVGSAIVGPTVAAAYPGLTAALGNLVISTAVNGGDVEAAAKTAFLSYAGGSAGGFVGAEVAAASNVELLGKVAGAVTHAFIVGGDLEKAAAFTLARNAGDVATLFESESENAMDYFTVNDSDPGFGYTAESFNFAPDISTIDVSQSFGGDAYGPALSPYASLTGEVFYTNDAAPSFGFDQPSFALPVTVPVEPPLPAPPESSFSLQNAREVVNSISQMALTALGVTKAFQAANNPTIVQQARTVTQSGAVVSALDTGIVRTQTIDGRVVNQRPPVGVAQSTVNGNVIVNNGDGTYTLIAPDGVRRVIQYGADSGSGLSDLPWPLIIGGVGALFALLKLRK
jgi:hypothetical protein